MLARSRHARGVCICRRFRVPELGQMSKRKDGQARGKYTLEFKLEAVRLVKDGQRCL